jgi:hypothetical protein
VSPVYVAIRLLTSVRDADADLVLAHLGGLSARLGKSIADSIGQQINAESDATEKVRFQRGGESALGQTRPRRPLLGAPYARPVLPSKRTHAGDQIGAALGQQRTYAPGFSPDKCNRFF